jgi:hypothetical protein
MASIQIRVDKSLVEVMEETRKKVAEQIKRDYGLNEVTIPGTFTSQVLAAQLSGKKTVKFKVNKVSKDRGFLELL